MAARPDTLRVLQAHGTSSVFHYTTCANAVGIFRAGALYSRTELERRGLPFSSEHYFGDGEKQELLGRYVSLANQPPWGMMKEESEPLVILRFGVQAAAAPGSCFCPGWSPLGRFQADEIVTWTEPDNVEDLYAGTGAQMVVGAEIFVPDVVEFFALQELVYFDKASRDRSLAELRMLVEQEGPRLGRTLTVAVTPARFPTDWRRVGPPWEDA